MGLKRKQFTLYKPKSDVEFPLVGDTSVSYVLKVSWVSMEGLDPWNKTPVDRKREYVFTDSKYLEAALATLEERLEQLGKLDEVEFDIDPLVVNPIVESNEFGSYDF